jgi:hypothetical protein
MLKLSGISSDQNNKSCRIIRHESNKICFAFFWFFYDFLRNLKETEKTQTLFQLQFCSQALEKNYLFCNVVPGGRAAAVRPNSGQPPAGAGRARAGEVSYGPPWAHYLGGYQDRLLGGPLGLPGLRYTAPEGVEHKDYTGVVLG